MPSFITRLLPANRVAALTTWLVGLSAFIVSVLGTFPHSWQNTAVAIVGLLKMLITTLHFMSGSQKFDSRQVPPPPVG